MRKCPHLLVFDMTDALDDSHVKSVCRLIERHQYLKVGIFNQARLSLNSVGRLFYSAVYMNRHSFSNLSLENLMNELGNIYPDDDWDEVLDAVDQCVEERGQRVLNRGEIVTYEDGIHWRKQPKPGTVSAMVRENMDARCPKLVPINTIDARMQGLIKELGKDRANMGNSVLRKNKVRRKMALVHEIAVHPQYALMKDCEEFEARDKPQVRLMKNTTSKILLKDPSRIVGTMDKSVEAERPDKLPDMELMSSLHRAMSQAGSGFKGGQSAGSSRSGRESEYQRGQREYQETMTAISQSFRSGDQSARSSTALVKMKKKSKKSLKV